MNKPISHRAMYSSVSHRALSFSIRDEEMSSMAQRVSGAGNGVFSVIKKLVPKDFMRDINRVMTSSNQANYKLTISTGVRGLRILPTTLFDDHAIEQRNLKEEFEKYVAEAEERYPTILEEAPNHLGAAFKIEEFPSVAQFRSAFDFKVSYSPISDSFKDWRLEGISEDNMEEAREAALRDMEDRLVNVTKDLYGKAEDMLNRFAEMGDTGVRASTVEAMGKFIENFRYMNLTDDPEIDEIANRMKEFTKVKADSLRYDAEERNRVSFRASDLIRRIQKKYEEK